MISVAVMAHPARAAAAEALAIETGATLVWDEIGDEWHTGARAIAACNPDASHHIVLQDDALPVRAFLEHAAAAIAQHPDRLISFYLGTSKPARWQQRVAAATTAADAAGVAWLTASRLLHGVAIAMPTTRIPQLLTDCSSDTLPYDERIGYWFNSDPLYTWPSLVDHADEPTLVSHLDGQPRTAPRRARRLGIPQSWDTEVIRI